MTNNEQVNVRDIRGRACLLVIGMAKHLECWTSVVHVLYLYDTCQRVFGYTFVFNHAAH